MLKQKSTLLTLLLATCLSSSSWAQNDSIVSRLNGKYVKLYIPTYNALISKSKECDKAILQFDSLVSFYQTRIESYKKQTESQGRFLEQFAQSNNDLRLELHQVKTKLLIEREDSKKWWLKKETWIGLGLGILTGIIIK